MIYIKAYADLAKYLKIEKIGEVKEFDNKNKIIKIAKIAEFYKIPLEEISIILLNGEYSTMNDFAKNNDTIIFFSPVDGG